MRCCPIMMTLWSRSTSGPAQPGGPTAAQPAQRDQPPHRVQPIVVDVLKERGQLRGGPHRDREALPGAAPQRDALIGPHLRLRPARRG